ncbi:MAG: DNA topoisomerase IV [Bacteroidetes bacterium HGW-Bacteroidetes-1]|jgi:topoisomerase-4 subunit A|nr:MAG: DNA topoisomerase IV [Bacteroidetes bacterium HGW-Bacteroidetes-1]
MSQSEELNRDGMPIAQGQKEQYRTVQLSGMYENWFLDYASYVILERAVPDINDGLKPVQRRLFHAMKQLDDGRYNKVANIIGHTMQYHPHGDASIGDALVQLGQKELAVDTQGNWGNILTGDSAAAARYIEARLSKFAMDVVFNPKITEWKLSYDGRNKEPITLPVKFPLLLVQGVEGIAVGLASKILPHNFNELIDASIDHLNGKDFELYPDFLTGGLADVSKYNDGLRGGRVRIRARITQLDKKTLIINEIPFSTTTGSLIDSVIAANDKGKIKIRKIDDNTAQNVEIVIQLTPGVSPDQTIDALYAFTQCEVAVSPNSCVIMDGKPAFLGMKNILRYNAERTKMLLGKELEIRLEELESDWHYSSLEKIFIEKRIYHDIEQSETWEDVIETIAIGLKPFISLLHREVTRDDIIRLTEIKIKRISKFNAFKADEYIKGVEDEIEEVKNHLEHLTDYAINFFKQIKKKYGQGHERRTELRSFDNIQASSVAANNEKLYVNKNEGFAGFSLKKDEFVCECSDIDDMIVFRENGTFLVTKVSAKSFVGENIIHIDIFRKNDDRTVYNMVYRDGRKGPWFIKRFSVLGVTRDKEYDLTAGKEDSKVFYFTANPNGEAEIIKVLLRPKPKLKKTNFEFDFATLTIKGRGSKGNILTKNPIKLISKRENGVSTLGARTIWYDETVKRLNTDGRGEFVGDFMGDDHLMLILSNGDFKLTGYELSTHFDDDMTILRKYDPDEVFSVVYIEGETGLQYLKRFQIDEDTPLNKRFSMIGEHPQSKFLFVLFDQLPRLKLSFEENEKGRKPEDEEILVADFIVVKGYKAKGKRLSNHIIQNIVILKPLIPEMSDEDLDEAGEIESLEIVSVNEIPDGPSKDIKESETSNGKPDKNSFDGPLQMELPF